MLFDSNGIHRLPKRKDIKVCQVDATEEALHMGNQKVFNMLVLGGMLKEAPVVKIEGIEKGLMKSLPERHHKLIPMNIEAIQRGMEIVKEL